MHFRRNRRQRAEPTPATQPRWDAVSFLTVYLVLVCALPSYLTVPTLGSAGRPSTLWALAGLLWWIWGRVGAAVPPKGGSPALRITLTVFVACVLASYAYANFRGLPGPESSPADSGMLRLGGWIGIALIAADGIKTRDRLQALLARIVGAGTLMALLGLAQFWTGESLIDWISLPGFVVDQSASGVEGRGGFVRPQGTAAHPLEYGVVLCVALPVAISLAMTDQKHSAVARWFPSSVIAFASMLSVSRSALLGVLAAALILSLRWSPSVRLYALLAAGGLGGIMYAVAPGMAGTLKGMFLGVADDPSTVSRTNSYATAFEIAERNPVLGRGFGTFLPQYLILDNQFLGLLIEIGVLGLAVFLVLVVTAMVIPWSATSRSADAVTRQMGSAISASVAATALTFAFFDGLGFPMSAGLLFLMIGLAGSLAEAGRSADMPSGVKVPPQVLKN